MGLARFRRWTELRESGGHGDSDHRLRSLHSGFIQRGLWGSLRDRSTATGAYLPCAHTTQGSTMGRLGDRSSQLSELPRVPFLLCASVSLPMKDRGSFQPRRGYKCSSGFAGPLWASGYKLPPRISGLTGPKPSPGLTQPLNPLMGSHSGRAHSAHMFPGALPTFC